jgi:hypothetical protein
MKRNEKSIVERDDAIVRHGQQHNGRGGGMTITSRRGQITPPIQRRARNHPPKYMLETPSFKAYS